MIRLNILVEGQTEETFVRDILIPHLSLHNIATVVRCVTTSAKKNRVFRGGITTYQKMARDLTRWIKQDPTAWYSTMFDLYALPDDFPLMNEAKRINDPYDKVIFIEKTFQENINHWRFIPYIQLHEFEALLLSKPEAFSEYFLSRENEIEKLQLLCAEYDSPERINEGVQTAPSKRIISEIPEYASAKATAGPLIAEEIGLAEIRRKCQHFNDWLIRIISRLTNVNA